LKVVGFKGRFAASDRSGEQLTQHNTKQNNRNPEFRVTDFESGLRRNPESTVQRNSESQHLESDHPESMESEFRIHHSGLPYMHGAIICLNQFELVRYSEV
jgi:hypothetical protein